MAERIYSISGYLQSRARKVQSLPEASQQATEDARPLLLSEGRKAVRVRSGALQRSLRVTSRARGDRTQLVIASRDPAARVQEEGATLRSNGRPMTVPVGAFLAEGMRDASDVPGLFPIRARDGRVYLATRSGRQLSIRFALRHEVRQEGRGWATTATKSAARKMEPDVRRRFVKHLTGRP